ncbi:uncharacterized protein LOC111624930 [Centruroides sculpturatus]|uniref:uncharacterized protein LOC111624930 n=1 Tax=Centruroides sculpturatus TaxID=218467 RepID=UPI000C6D25B4|nr:uncharacterized protein LOC111624930 [Centruroides sculpturatus]
MKAGASPSFPPSRHEREPHAGIDLTFPPPALVPLSRNSSSSSYQSQLHYSPRLPPHHLRWPSGVAHSSLYATGRRRPGVPEKSLPFSHYELKKSSSLTSGGMRMPSTPSAPSLSHPSPAPGSRGTDDLEASDSITDDDDTLSSGLSGE